jgi:hypothetical protein
VNLLQAFTSKRHADYLAAKAVQSEIVGADVFKGLEAFYKTIADLYAGGNLGGIEIVAVKPKGW